MRTKSHFTFAVTVAAWCLVGSVTAAAEPPAAAETTTTPAASSLTGESGKSLLQEINLGALWSANTLANWSMLLGAIFLGLLAGKVCASVLSKIGRRLEDRGWQIRAHVITDLVNPASLALFAVGLALGLAGLKGISPPLQAFCSKTLLLLYSVAVFWYAFNLVEIVDILLRRMTSDTKSTFNAQLIPLIRKTLRIFLVVIGVLFVVDSVFQQDIGAWLAGLGIAGLAVSLAAQDSLKNLFGSITILLDRPFQLGERIIYTGYDGVIEEIGFRSTKIRTFPGHLVTIPNSNIVNNPVENVGRRPFIRRILNVSITYDTPPAKIEQAVRILYDILEEEGIREPIHPAINGDDYPPRVFFNEYNPDSLNLFVVYWYVPPNYWDYMEHAHRLNLRIFEEFEKAGIEFAFPTQTLYLAGDPKRELALKMLGGDLRPPPA